MHPKNFGSEKIVCTSVRLSTPSCKLGWNFAFQAPAPFGVKALRATRNFRDKKQHQQSRLFLSTALIDVDNREWARARDKKQRRPMTLEGLHGNFIAVVWKWEMLAATKMKMSGSEKIANRNTFNISSIKRVTREFLEVSRCSRAKQLQRSVQKSVLHVQSCCCCCCCCFAN